MSEDKYVWSSDEELFTSDQFDTRADALTNAEEYYAGECRPIWTGKVRQYTFTVDGDNLCDNLCEHAYDEVGECCEDWLVMTKEESAMFTELLTNTVVKFFEDHSLMPSFYGVADVERHELKEAPDAQ